MTPNSGVKIRRIKICIAKNGFSDRKSCRKTKDRELWLRPFLFFLLLPFSFRQMLNDALILTSMAGFPDLINFSASGPC